MHKSVILLLIIVGLIAYIESKKYSESKEGKQENEGKREQKYNKENKNNQKEESKKGKENGLRYRKTKENVKQKQKDEVKDEQKQKGKQQKSKKEEKTEKVVKDTEKQQQMKEKPKESNSKDQSCPKDDISCGKTPESEAAPVVCTIHGDCQPGSCCKPPGVCQQIEAREGQKCWNTCMCGGGLLCFSDGASKDATGICKVPAPEDLTSGSYLQ